MKVNLLHCAICFSQCSLLLKNLADFAFSAFQTDLESEAIDYEVDYEIKMNDNIGNEHVKCMKSDNLFLMPETQDTLIQTSRYIFFIVKILSITI